ncbi:MAG TPA: type II toxin-antitoxin system PemK/MazF family toxin [Pseudolabrys sp.]|jgi:mRNA interferase MazF|nr:type II toxin-antitoxin system PemK/MazF family toxin [Pseudolabrys sp.]
MHLPNVGDIVWVDLDPIKGIEQAGRRPALVLTPRSYHEKSGGSVICPITSKAGFWPWNVQLPTGLQTEGVVLVDQIRTIDRGQRMFGVIETAPDDVIAEVLGRLASLLGINLLATGAGPDAP